MNAADPSSEGRASARPIIGLAAPTEKSGTRRSTSLREGDGRQHPIHLAPFEKPNLAIIIFVTCSSAQRQPLLASPAVHDAIVSAWGQASPWLVGRYVVMPNHVHLFCAPNGIDAPSLERWMSFWKSRATIAIGRHKGEIWQRDHWDRQLRSGESYDQKWDYIRTNPVRHGYVKNAEDWPYQGELNEFRW